YVELLVLSSFPTRRSSDLQALGWGFQLQSPLTVALLALLFFALALSLSGLFEWRGLFSGRGQALTDKQGAAGSFFTGVLACVVRSEEHTSELQSRFDLVYR